MYRTFAAQEEQRHYNVPNTRQIQQDGRDFSQQDQRQQDIDFELKVQSLRNSEKQVEEAKKLWKKFPQYIKGIKELCGDISDNLIALYPPGTPYYEPIKEVIEVHIEVEKLYSVLVSLYDLKFLE